jgi:hypothetical protein
MTSMAVSEPIVVTPAKREEPASPYRYLLPGSIALALLTALGLFAWMYGPAYWAYWSYAPQEGDILFQSLPRSPLTNAIEGTTNSPYSHCGMVAQVDGEWVVYEAFRGVEATPLREFLFRGRNQGFAVYRLKPEFQQHLPATKAALAAFVGRPYDSRYRWDDEAI